MTRTRRIVAYAASAALVTGILTGAMWPWIEPAARGGLFHAALVALGFQTFAFGVWVWIWERPGGFLLGLAGGMLARMGLVSLVAIVAAVGDRGRPWTVAVVLGLIGHLFALVLLEAWFIQAQADSTQGIEPTT